MKILISLTCFIMASTAFGQNTIYDFKFTSITGEEISFNQFKGKKILVVNTASECGFTKQYEGLQNLHENYGDQLVIIGFPANDFGAQEPGNNNEIAAFCKKNYGVTFLMAQKIVVTGGDIAPLFKWLCTEKNENFTGDINWNFEKFLLDEEGHLIARFRSAVEPISEEIISHLGKG